jgi:vitamin B12 transporter
MLAMRIFSIGTFLILLASASFAAPLRDSILLKEVRIIQTRSLTEKPVFKLDTQRKQQVEMQSLARFLQENTSIQFKSYGSSGSSVMSIRGANSSQSKVVWNGMNIGSPMLNMNDFSLLAVNNAEQIELFKGGASAAEGTGALAGYIKMSSDAGYNKTFASLSIDRNSIDNTTTQLKFHKGSNTFSSSTSVQYLQHQNNFNYANRAELNAPLQKQVNSRWVQFAIIQSFYVKLKKAELQWHQWYQESDRQLSPPMYNRMRTSYQFDKSYRSIASIKRTLNANLSIQSNIAYTREVLRYVSRVMVNNTNLEIFNSNSYFDQVQHQIKLIYRKGNFDQQLLYTFNFDGAYVADYAQYVKRYRASVASIQTYNFNNRLAINFSNRVEWLKNAQYFASSVNINYIRYIVSGFIPYFRISKNYNLPGLNDLYWTPGGNPNLSAERSFEQEIGLSHQKEFKKWKNKTTLAAYHSNVRDWILWQPSAIENGVWTPQNLVEVKLQGLELEQEFRYQFNAKHRIDVNLFYARIIAINNKAVNASDQTVGKQIIYIPEEKWGINVNYKYKNSSININTHRVSHRYTAADHSIFLPAYTLVDARIQQQFRVKNHAAILAFYVDNLTNTVYESIPFQAMPARVFGIHFNYQINQINK